MGYFFETEREGYISIVIVNYKNAEVTCQLLHSIKRLSYTNIQVILVDNESDGKEIEKYKKILPSLTYLCSATNLGFAGANNLGIQKAIGEFIFLLNNDTELETNLMENMLSAFQKDIQIGVVSPKIYFFDTPQIIQYAGFTAINPYTGRNQGLGFKENEKGQYNQGYYTEYAHGAAMMLKRKVIEKAGLMTEDYFLYYEELDWCQRIKQHGFKVYFQPDAVVYHKESVSVGVNSPLKVFYNTRNRIWFLKRNFPIHTFIVFTIYYWLIAFPKGILLYTISKQWAQLNAFLKGSFNGFLKSK